MKFESGIIPTSVSIPSIGVEANILQVGLQEDGIMEVPEDVMEVGWYTNGAKPGQNGNVVLAGHVDSYLGPGIFFNLKNVSIDDEIIISNGEEIVKYRIVKKEAYPYDQGPIEEIFGYTSQKRLHLITCTGRYNPFTDNHAERLVVTAIAEG
ncbi:class F sortase [Cytobacillus sp. FJAT-54145]|uniref:Class F sortase n=1 Tax=Cytobacillus spartinae TaxID=3299023 RepID=A0ABW6KCN0_9BACI